MRLPRKCLVIGILVLFSLLLTVYCYVMVASLSHVFVGRHFGPAYSVCFSPDSSNIVSSGADGVFIWNVATQKKIMSIDPGDFANAVFFSNDGNDVGVVCSHSAYVYNTASGALAKVIPLDQMPPWMSLHRRNARHSNAEVRIELPPNGSAKVHLGSGPTQAVIDTSEAEVNAWAIVDESILITCHGSMTNPLPSVRGSLRLWNLHTGQLVKQFSFKGGAISDVNVSGDDQLLATANTDGTVTVYRIHDLLSR